ARSVIGSPGMKPDARTAKGSAHCIVVTDESPFTKPMSTFPLCGAGVDAGGGVVVSGASALDPEEPQATAHATRERKTKRITARVVQTVVQPTCGPKRPDPDASVSILTGGRAIS